MAGQPDLDKQLQPAPLTRREAMLQLLRVGGVAAGAAAGTASGPCPHSPKRPAATIASAPLNPEPARSFRI